MSHSFNFKIKPLLGSLLILAMVVLIVTPALFVKAANHTVTWTTDNDFQYNAVVGPDLIPGTGDDGTDGDSTGNSHVVIDNNDLTISAQGFKSVVAAGGAGFVLGIKDDGTLWSWGDNEEGELGVADIISKNTPTQVGTDTDWATISAGYQHAMALKTDGTLWSWGDNTYGQLGLAESGESANAQWASSATASSQYDDPEWSASQATGAPDVDSCGDNSSAWAPADSGTDPEYLQVGFTTPVNATGLAVHETYAEGSIYQIDLIDNSDVLHTVFSESDGTACGDYFTLEFSPTAYLVKGIKIYTQIGDYEEIDAVQLLSGGVTPPSLPTPPPDSADVPTQVGTDTDWESISAGDYQSFSIKSDGTLWAWGNNDYGQLGLGTTGGTQDFPVQVGTDTDWLNVTSGGYHTVALKSDGTLWAWGYNNEGELGLGDTDDHNTPNQVGVDTDWTSLSVGEYHTLALKSDGTLWSWGYNSDGQLGFGDTNDIYVPTQVGTDTDWEKLGILSGSYHSAAIKQDGTLWTWGYNINGGLGVGDPVAKHVPTQVGTDTDWDSVALGYSDFTVAVKTDQTFWTWGYNGYGQLGQGNFNALGFSSNGFGQESSPTQEFYQNTDWQSVDDGNGHVVAIKSDGTLWAWGWDAFGRLGFGSYDTDNPNILWAVPTQIGSDTDWAEISAATQSTLALKQDGTLWAWGLNDHHQLGLGDTTDRLSPTQVGVDTDWEKISAATGSASFAIKSDGTLWSWGYNGNGQLGQGNNTELNVPTKVGVATDWQSVSGGAAFTLATKAGGLWSWGTNGNHQLGLGADTSEHDSPTQIGVLTTWASVSAGSFQGEAIKQDGTLWSWGSNTAGQLCLGDTTERNSPTQVGALTTWGTVAAGGTYAIALKTDGTLWACGKNTEGRLGVGDLVDYSSPTQVGADTDWESVSVTPTNLGSVSFSSHGIKTDGTLYGWGDYTLGKLGTFDSMRPQQMGSDTDWSLPTPDIFSTAVVDGYKVNVGGGEQGNWESISWATDALPANTSLEWRVRTSDDDLTYSAWSSSFSADVDGSTSGSVDLSSITDAQYIEIELTLVSSDGVGSPTLNNFSLNYDLASEDIPTPTHSLSISKAGTGGGTVTSSPAGIACGATCSAIYDEGTEVVLTAVPAVGSVFVGWSGGGCAGTGLCDVVLGSDTSVTAAFNLEDSGGGGGGGGGDEGGSHGGSSVVGSYAPSNPTPPSSPETPTPVAPPSSPDGSRPADSSPPSTPSPDTSSPETPSTPGVVDTEISTTPTEDNSVHTDSSSPSSSSSSRFSLKDIFTGHQNIFNVILAATLLPLLATTASAFSYAFASGFNMLSVANLVVPAINPKRKIKHWGVVYDSVTKRPLANCRVQLLDNNMRVLETIFTNNQGVYGFLATNAPAGEVNREIQLRVEKTGYTFPSSRPVSNDKLIYDHPYFGEVVKVSVDQVTNFDIPMDPLSNAPKTFTLGMFSPLVHNIFISSLGAFFYVALVVNLALLAYSPNILHLVGFGILLLVAAARAFGLKPKPYGTVLDRYTGEDLPFVLIAAYDQSGTKISFTVSDDKGRYFLITPKGKYTVKAYTPSHISPMRSVDLSVSTDKGWVSGLIRL